MSGFLNDYDGIQPLLETNEVADSFTTDDLREPTPFQQIDAIVQDDLPQTVPPKYGDLVEEIEKQWPDLECFMDADFQGVSGNIVTQALKKELADSAVYSEKVKPKALVFTVDFYSSADSISTGEKQKYRLFQRFEFLGSQNLTSICKSFYCKRKTKNRTGEDGSEFVYAGGNFYCHKQSNRGVSMTKKLAKCIVNISGNSETPQVLDLEKTELSQVSNILTRKPYLYCHDHGLCEHVFYISNVNIWHNSQPSLTSQYPHITYQRKLRRIKCMACKSIGSRFISQKNRYSLYEPGYYCLRCTSLLCYDDEGKLTPNEQEIRLFPYSHHN